MVNTEKSRVKTIEQRIDENLSAKPPSVEKRKLRFGKVNSQIQEPIGLSSSRIGTGVLVGLINRGQMQVTTAIPMNFSPSSTLLNFDVTMIRQPLLDWDSPDNSEYQNLLQLVRKRAADNLAVIIKQEEENSGLPIKVSNIESQWDLLRIVRGNIGFTLMTRAYNVNPYREREPDETFYIPAACDTINREGFIGDIEYFITMPPDSIANLTRVVANKTFWIHVCRALGWHHKYAFLRWAELNALIGEGELTDDKVMAILDQISNYPLIHDIPDLASYLADRIIEMAAFMKIKNNLKQEDWIFNTTVNLIQRNVSDSQAMTSYKSYLDDWMKGSFKSGAKLGSLALKGFPVVNISNGILVENSAIQFARIEEKANARIFLDWYQPKCINAAEANVTITMNRFLGKSFGDLTAQTAYLTIQSVVPSVLGRLRPIDINEEIERIKWPLQYTIISNKMSILGTWLSSNVVSLIGLESFLVGALFPFDPTLMIERDYVAIKKDKEGKDVNLSISNIGLFEQSKLTLADLNQLRPKFMSVLQ